MAHGSSHDTSVVDSSRDARCPDYADAMAATYSARDVAAQIRHRLPGVPVKKLHKLLYYVQGHHLAAFGQPLFPETISACDMGPVVGQLWYTENQEGPSADAVELDEAALNTVGSVVSRYGRLSGTELERLTHGEPPWQEADDRRSAASRSQRIDLETMREFFAAEPDGEDTGSPPLDSAAVARWLSDVQPGGADELSEDTAASLLARSR